jgi:hypothetical protein
MVLAALICLVVFTIALKKALKIYSTKKSIAETRQWIQKCEAEEENRDRLVQRQIYLLEEMDRLRKQQDKNDDDDTDRLKTLQQEHDHTVQELWLHKEAYARLMVAVRDLKTGPGADECWDEWFLRPARKPKRRLKMICRTRGGCCERECKCCFNPRRTTAGKEILCWNFHDRSYDMFAHCTEECACCRRYWGFRRVVRDEDDGSLMCIK